MENFCGRQGEEAQEYVPTPSPLTSKESTPTPSPIPTYALTPTRRPYRIIQRDQKKRLTKPGDLEPPTAIASNRSDGHSHNPPVAAARPKTRSQLEFEAAGELLQQEINEATGFAGPPGAESSKEEHERYLVGALAYLSHKDHERHDQWPELEKADEFIRQMHCQPFRLLDGGNGEDGGGWDNDEYDYGYSGAPVPEFKRFRDPPPVRSSKTKSSGGRKLASTKQKQQQQQRQRQRQRQRQNQKEISESSKKHSSGSKKQSQTQSESHSSKPKKQWSDDETQTRATSIAALSSTASAAPSDEQQQQQQQQQSARKRRKLEEELQTALGAGWDAHVDDFGRRPRRGAPEKMSF